MTKLSKKELKKSYPRIHEIGLEVYTDQIQHIRSDDLEPALAKAGLSREKFSEYFGCQTCPLIEKDGKNWHGLYPWDVEPVLERLISKRIVGNQRPELWD